MALITAAATAALVGKVIDGVAGYFPNAEQAAKAKAAATAAVLKGKSTLLDSQMRAIVEEARSADKWTSRARPSFMYVMYIMMLAAIPMGMLSAFDQTIATAVADGMKSWLGGIPDGMWTTFGVGYAGYAGVRSWDKHQESNKDKDLEVMRLKAELALKGIDPVTVFEEDGHEF